MGAFGNFLVQFAPSISWPLSVFLIFFLFRIEIRDFLSKFSEIKVDYGGASVQMGGQQPQTSAANSNETEDLLAHLKEQNADDVLDEQEMEKYPVLASQINQLKSQIEELPTSDQPGAKNQIISALITHSARLDFRRWCEKTNQIIFPEQIHLMQEIVKKEQITIDEIEKIFSDIKLNNLVRFEKWTHVEFIQYLSSEKLIYSQDTNFTVTDLGLSFLSWLKERPEHQ